MYFVAWDAENNWSDVDSDLAYTSRRYRVAKIRFDSGSAICFVGHKV